MIFKALDANAVVIDSYQPPPDATAAALKNYKHIKRNSLLLLLQVISEPIMAQIARQETSQQILQYLHKTYYKDSPLSLFNEMHAFYTVNGVFDPSQSVTKYIDEFEVRLTRLYGYTSNVNPTRSCYKADYRKLPDNDKYQRDCLLSALVKHYPNVVDNLTTKGDLFYEDLKERLTSLSSNGQLNGYGGGNNTSGPNGNTSTVLVVAGKGNNKNKKKKGQQGQQGQQAQTLGTKECSYCKRHGGRYKGHNWQDCRTLKRDQIKKKKNADAQIAEAQLLFAYAEGFITEVSSQLQNDGIHSWKFDT